MVYITSHVKLFTNARRPVSIKTFFFQNIHKKRKKKEKKRGNIWQVFADPITYDIFLPLKIKTKNYLPTKKRESNFQYMISSHHLSEEVEWKSSHLIWHPTLGERRGTWEGGSGGEGGREGGGEGEREEEREGWRERGRRGGRRREEGGEGEGGREGEREGVREGRERGMR